MEQNEMMIEFKRATYILGMWYAERYKFGKVFIYAIKGKEENHWEGHIRYIYHNNNINMYLEIDNPNNFFFHSGIDENDMIKICNAKIEELHCIFSHEKDMLIVQGDINKLFTIAEKMTWIPPIREDSISLSTKAEAKLEKEKAQAKARYERYRKSKSNPKKMR